VRYLLVIMICISISIDRGAASPQIHHSDYAGQETRQIKSLSASDIEQLESGKGWGLAKAAELNGMPGPVHVLEMKEQIDLTPQQQQAISEIFTTMRSQAVPLGKKLVELERDLDAAFAGKTINETGLKNKLLDISRTRMELRYVHLKAHLETPSVLSPKQIAAYNELRGYTDGDPCASVPEGHDETMWRMHNGCD